MQDCEVPRSGQVILIADDKQSNRELLRAILEHANYVVVEAADGEAALLIAAESSPHLVILDIHMPKRDGFRVLEELRKDPILHAVPIMALTASASFSEQDRIMDSGFDACFVKPIGPARLREVVASLLLNRNQPFKSAVSVDGRDHAFSSCSGAHPDLSLSGEPPGTDFHVTRQGHG